MDLVCPEYNAVAPSTDDWLGACVRVRKGQILALQVTTSSRLLPIYSSRTNSLRCRLLIT